MVGHFPEFSFAAPFWNLKSVLRATKLIRKLEKETLVKGSSRKIELFSRELKGDVFIVFEDVMDGNHLVLVLDDDGKKKKWIKR